MRQLMRLILLVCSVFALGACDTSTSTESDFGVVLPGCRGPSACWWTNCPCVFSRIDECKLCDPETAPGGVCTCNSDGDAGQLSTCVEQAEVCVGRAATTCAGRCVRSTSMLGCMDPEAEPPNEVASVVGADGGPSTEKRCPYADDVCCL